MNEAIRQVLSDALPTLKDPRIGFVTVTAVQATRDFTHARVFVSVLGTDAERDRTLEGLRAAHGVLQAHVAPGASAPPDPGPVVRIRSRGRAGRAADEGHRRARAGGASDAEGE